MSWWSHTLLLIHLSHQNMLFGIELQTPRALWLTPFFLVLSLASDLHMRTFPEPRRRAQYRVVFPDAHVIIKWWKSTEAGDPFLQREVTCLCVLRRRGSGAGGKGLWKWTVRGRSGRGTFPGLLNEMWLFWLTMKKCSCSHHRTKQTSTETSEETSEPVAVSSDQNHVESIKLPGRVGLNCTHTVHGMDSGKTEF